MIQLDMRSHKSIYRQVVDNIKELILRGVLPPDSKLPSVRDLSRQLTINPNTVQKAFRELEREGYIYTVAGRGSFVGERKKAGPDPEQLDRIRLEVENIYRELRLAGMDANEAQDFVQKAMGKKAGEEQGIDAAQSSALQGEAPGEKEQEGGVR